MKRWELRHRKSPPVSPSPRPSRGGERAGAGVDVGALGSTMCRCGENLARSEMSLTASRQSLLSEKLERRTLLSGAVANINLSKLLGNQAEGSIVVDRADSSKVFAVSNLDVGDGLMAATSTDGGATWTRR